MLLEKLSGFVVSFISICALSLGVLSQSNANQPATDWLLSIQSVDGGFYQSTDISNSVQSTSEVISLFRKNGTPVDPLSYSFVSLNSYQGCEYISRKIISSIEAGNDVTGLVNQLLSFQNESGGFGEFIGYDSSILDTSFALIALAKHGYADDAVLNPAITYIRQQQQANGAFPLTTPNDSAVYVTALASIALQKYKFIYELSSEITFANEFILAQRDVDGAWLTNWESATSLLATIPTISDSSVYSASLQSLISRQLANGSWDNDIYTTALAAHVTSLTSSVDIPADPVFGTFTGQVLNSTTGLPLPGVTISLVQDSSVSATTLDDGRFIMDSVSPGLYDVSYQYAGYAVSTQQAQVLVGQSSDLGRTNLQPLPTTGIVSGVVTDAQAGFLIANALITFDGATTQTVLTDSMGGFSLAIPPGDVTITVSADGYDSLLGSGTIVAGGVLNVSPGLYQINSTPPVLTVEVKGTVNEADTSQPLSGVQVSVNNLLNSVTDTAGRFVIADAPEGLLAITISQAGYQPAQYQAQALAGGVIDLGSILLIPVQDMTSSSIIGRVLDATYDTPVVGAEIKVLGSASGVISNSNGEFRIENIPNTQFTVTSTALGYHSFSSNISLANYGTVSSSIRLQRSTVNDFDIVNVHTHGLSTSFEAYSEIEVDSLLMNTGLTATNVRLFVKIINASNQIIEQYPAVRVPLGGDPSEGVLVIDPDMPLEVEVEWRTGSTQPGQYTFVVQAYDADSGVLLAERGTAFDIVPTQNIGGGARFDPPVTHLASKTPVKITATVQNRGNAPVAATTITANVRLKNYGYQPEEKAFNVETFINDGSIVQPKGMAVDLDGSLLVVDHTNNNLSRIDTNGTITEIASGFTLPVDVDIDALGNIYVVNDRDKVTRLSADLTQRTEINTGLRYQQAIKCLPDGRVLLATYESLHEITPQDTVNLLISGGISHPRGMAVNSQNVIYIASSYDNKISKYDNGSLSTFVDTINKPHGIAVDALDNLYVTSYSDGTLHKVTPAGEVTTIAAGLSGPYDVKITSDGNFIVSNNTASEIVSISPLGDITVLATASITSPQAAVYNASGEMFVANASISNIVKIGTDNRATVLANGVAGVKALQPTTDGSVAVLDNGSIKHISPSGIKTTLATGIATPQQFTKAPDNNGYLVTNRSTGIERVDSNGLISDFVPRQLFRPKAMRTGVSGEVVILDYYGLSRINADGTYQRIYAGPSSLMGLAVDSFNNIYTTNPTTKEILVISPSGVDTVHAVTSFTPSAVAVNSAGQLYIAERYSGNIYILDNLIETLHATLNYQVNGDMHIDSQDALWVTHRSDHRVAKLDSGNAVSYFDVSTYPTGLASDSLGGVYVSTRGKVFNIDDMGTVAEFIADPVIANRQLSSVAIDASGNFITADADAILNQFNPDAMFDKQFTSLYRPAGIDSMSDGSLIIANGNGTIVKLKSGNHLPEVVGRGSFTRIDVISNQEAVLANYSSVARLNLLDGSVSNISSGISNITAITADSTGAYAVLSSTASAILYFSSADILIDQVVGLTSPRGLLIEPTGDILVANGTSGSGGIARLRTDGKLVSYSGQKSVQYLHSGTNNEVLGSYGNGIYRIDASGDVKGSISGKSIHGIVVDLNGNILGASHTDAELGQYSIDGSHQILASSVSSITDMVTDAQGNAYVTNKATGSIIRITNSYELITEYTDLPGIQTAVFADDGTVFASHSTSILTAIEPDASRQHQDMATAIQTIDEMVISNNVIYASMLEVNNNKILKLRPVEPAPPLQIGDLVYTKTVAIPYMGLDSLPSEIGLGEWLPSQSGDFDLEMVVNDGQSGSTITSQLHVGALAEGALNIAEQTIVPGTRSIDATLNILGADSTSISKLDTSATTLAPVPRVSLSSMVADTKGNIYTINNLGITKHTLDGESSIFAEVLSYANSIVIDSKDNIYIGGGKFLDGPRNLIKVNPQGQVTTLLTLDSIPTDLAIDNEDNISILIGTSLYRYNKDNTLYKLTTIGKAGHGLNVDVFGNFYILDRYNTILKVSPDGKNIEPHVTNATFEYEKGFNVATDCSNNLIFAPSSLLPFKANGEEDIIVQHIGNTGQSHQIMYGPEIDPYLNDMDDLYYDRFQQRMLIWSEHSGYGGVYSFPITCGSIDVEAHIITRSDVDLSHAIPAPTSSMLLADGTRQYIWSLKDVGQKAFNIQLNMLFKDLQEGESRPVVKDSYLLFNNSFDPANPVKVALDIPSVAVSSGMTTSISLDKTQYGPNSDVTVSVNLSNAANVDFNGSVQVKVVDASGVEVTTLPVTPITGLVAGGSQTVTSIWNTGLTYTGEYAIEVSVLNQSELPINNSNASFVIATTELENIVLSSTLYTDKTAYLAWDSVNIEARVMNVSENAISQTSSAQLLVTSSTLAVLYNETFDVRNLGPAAYQNIYQQLNLSNAESGEYTVSLIISDSAKLEELTSNVSKFTVGISESESNISASVAVSAKQISTSDSITCNAEYTNHSNDDISSVALKNVLYSVATGSVLSTETVSVDITANANHTQVFNPDTTTLEEGSYLCMVGAGNNEKLLATAGFVVINNAPAIDLVTEISPQGKGRILILLDDPIKSYDLDPHGPIGFPLLTEQKQYLETLLTNDGWSYTIVSNQNDFITALYKGGYTDYALFNEHNYLLPHVQNVLREAVYSGAGLLVAGGANQVNHMLGLPLGVKFTGQDNHDNILNFVESPLNLLGEFSLGLYEHVKNVRVEGASIAASYIDTQPPLPFCFIHDDGNKAALLTYEYGNGRSVYAAFDLLGQASSFGYVNQLEAVLNNALAYIDPAQKLQKPGKMVPINISLSNLGADTNSRVLITLPAGMNVTEAKSGTVNGNVISLTHNLIQNQSITETVWVELGVEPLPASVLVQTQVEVAGEWLDFNTQSILFAVDDVATIDDAILAINNASGYDRGLRIASLHLEIAKRKLKRNRFILALLHLEMATTRLHYSNHAQRHEIRLMVDDAISTTASKVIEASQL